MTRFLVRSFLSVTLIAVLISSATAGSKEDDARQLLQKSFQQADIWTEGPLQLVANVKLPRPKKPAVELTYTISWAGPDKWRAEWSGGNYSRIIVASNGKMYRYSSTEIPPLPILQFERGLGALNGHAFGGPWGGTPKLTDAKVEISGEKFGTKNADCLSVKGQAGELCVDRSSGRVITYHPDASLFEYSDYATVGSAAFPRTVRQLADKDVLEEGAVTITLGATVSESLFVPPANAITGDFPVCGSNAMTFEGAILDKKVMPEYPQSAREARHQGTVWLYAVVGKDGAIQSLKPMAGALADLEASAMKAVKDWKYSPYVRCGQPVQYETVISVIYSLER
jgi:TonB family protein